MLTNRKQIIGAARDKVAILENPNSMDNSNSARGEIAKSNKRVIKLGQIPLEETQEPESNDREKEVDTTNELEVTIPIDSKSESEEENENENKVKLKNNYLFFDFVQL